MTTPIDKIIPTGLFTIRSLLFSISQYNIPYAIQYNRKCGSIETSRSPSPFNPYHTKKSLHKLPSPKPIHTVTIRNAHFRREVYAKRTKSSRMIPLLNRHCKNNPLLFHPASKKSNDKLFRYFPFCQYSNQNNACQKTDAK